MSYSEGGPSNGQIYKRPIDTGLNHSGSIRIWLGDLPVQLQGLNLMRVSRSWTPKLNILKILKHFWPASEPCRQATISIWTLYFLCVPLLPSPIHTVYMKHGHAQLIHSSLSNLGTISLKSGNLRVKMSYSEGGPSNGQIYKRPIDTGLNHSGSIPIWLGDLPVQLQGLTLCGSVTVGRQNWIFLKF